VGRLRAAVSDLSWLLTRGYAMPSSLKIVGDRHALDQRQRTAVMRAACSDAARHCRASHAVAAGDVAGRAILIDGYNVLTTIEAALAGGVLLACRDGTFRDMASLHGSFRKVEETRPALTLIGQSLAGLRPAGCVFYLDSPVSNSGRLKTLMAQIAQDNAWNWDIRIVPSPDAVLASADDIIATADSVILDRCTRWFGLAAEVLQRHGIDANVLDLNVD
jgi:hypothetical protein